MLLKQQLSVYKVWNRLWIGDAVIVMEAPVHNYLQYLPEGPSNHNYN